MTPDVSGCSRSLRSGIESPCERRGSPAYSAARSPRRARGADGSVRRLGDARPVRGRDPGARRRPPRPGRLRRLPHGPAARRGAEAGGPAAEPALERPRRLGDGDAQYTLLTNERGGIVDDLIAYRIGPGHTCSSSTRATRRCLRVDQGARDPGHRGARRVRRVRAPRRAGPDGDHVARAAGRARVHARDGRGLTASR